MVNAQTLNKIAMRHPDFLLQQRERCYLNKGKDTITIFVINSIPWMLTNIIIHRKMQSGNAWNYIADFLFCFHRHDKKKTQSLPIGWKIGNWVFRFELENSSNSLIKTTKKSNKQESPPMWMQEAYQLRWIKYPICCPVLGGYPIPARGYPHPDLAGGYPIPTGGYPTLGTPHPHLDLARGYHIPARGYYTSGNPHLDLTRVYPIWTWPAYPPSGPGWGTPCLGLAWVTPNIWTWSGYPPPPIWNWPGYPSVDKQTDTCQNITFPSYYVRGR